MKLVPMIAAQRMRYGTRRLVAGDTFQATRDEAVLFRALRWAKDGEGSDTVARNDEVLRTAVMQAADDIDVLRTEYEQRAGKSADKRWGVSRLKTEIEALS